MRGLQVSNGHSKHTSVPNITGHLVLVVGPSGVGKDSLLEGARAALSDDETLRFPRREITRPAEAGGEDHTPVTEDQFHARADLGGYALHWGAHGLWYGIGTAIDDDLAQGHRVVVNVSRTVLDQARARYSNLTIVAIDAPETVLRARLKARGRETPEDIERRLARARAFQVSGPDVVTFTNAAPLAESVCAFTNLLRTLD